MAYRRISIVLSHIWQVHLQQYLPHTAAVHSRQMKEAVILFYVYYRAETGCLAWFGQPKTKLMSGAGDMTIKRKNNEKKGVAKTTIAMARQSQSEKH